MVARREYAAAALSKARDALTVRDAQPVARVNGEEPKLVEVRRVETAENLVVAVGVRLAVARHDFAERASIVALQRREMSAQQREPADVPIVFDVRDCSLQKNANRYAHDLLSVGIGLPAMLSYNPSQRILHVSRAGRPGGA